MTLSLLGPNALSALLPSLAAACSNLSGTAFLRPLCKRDEQLAQHLLSVFLETRDVLLGLIYVGAPSPSALANGLEHHHFSVFCV